MQTTLFVISDLHLGGEPGSDGAPGFQICPPANQAKLVEFINHLPAPESDADVRLVINGDLVDFLAEVEFRAFSIERDVALTKLRRIIGRTPTIWEALREFLRRGGALTLMLGNHDIELCMPQVRHALLETIGSGRVEFLYDNEAFTCGPVLIEHGNRYDTWNAVRYGALRRVRSQLSRGVEPLKFPAPPGSQLVAEVMNGLKKEYSFIDLLKPEDAGVLPILAALGAGSLRNVWQGYKKYRQTHEVVFDDDQQPVEETFISGGIDVDQELFNLAEDIAAGGDATQVSGGGDWLRGARHQVAENVRDYRRRKLLEALRARAELHKLTFDITNERPEYQTAATTSAKNGYDVIVYGHTHLVKRIEIEVPGRTALYLNGGTWADLIRVPQALWGKDKPEAKAVVTQFLNDLEADTIARWRCPVPTFAKIEVDGVRVQSADVYFAEGANATAVTQKEFDSRLEPEASHA